MESSYIFTSSLLTSKSFITPNTFFIYSYVVNVSDYSLIATRYCFFIKRDDDCSNTISRYTNNYIELHCLRITFNPCLGFNTKISLTLIQNSMACNHQPYYILSDQ